VVLGAARIRVGEEEGETDDGGDDAGDEGEHAHAPLVGPERDGEGRDELHRAARHVVEERFGGRVAATR